MTSEEDFQAALDANLKDWQTRLVFADWLQERGDPRAAGYRELGRLRLHPILCIQSSGGDRHYIFGHVEVVATLRKQYRECLLPRPWYTRCRKGDAFGDNAEWKFYLTRRAADDAAALAFTERAATRRTKKEKKPAKRKKKQEAAKPVAKKPTKRQEKKKR